MKISGHDYMGIVNTTSSGRQCQSWSSNTPHVPDFRYSDAHFPDGSILAAENYCRNPEQYWHHGVWCYTMDPSVEREPCDVPACGKSNKFCGPLFLLQYVLKSRDCIFRLYIRQDRPTSNSAAQHSRTILKSHYSDTSQSLLKH